LFPLELFFVKGRGGDNYDDNYYWKYQKLEFDDYSQGKKQQRQRYQDPGAADKSWI
jgi:hypothetical protein